MTIAEAFAEFINSKEFKDIAKKRDDKTGSKYRIYKGRFAKGTLKVGAMVELLLENDYKVTVTKD